MAAERFTATVAPCWVSTMDSRRWKQKCHAMRASGGRASSLVAEVRSDRRIADHGACDGRLATWLVGARNERQKQAQKVPPKGAKVPLVEQHLTAVNTALIAGCRQNRCKYRPARLQDGRLLSTRAQSGHRPSRRVGPVGLRAPDRRVKASESLGTARDRSRNGVRPKWSGEDCTSSAT